MEVEGQGFTNGHANWTSAMSSFMLSYLSNVVSSGERTSSGFKKVHYNSCAKAINEKFQIALNGEQIKNHLKTWSRRFAKINRIRKVSGKGWDEDSFTITMDEEHYNGYVKVLFLLPTIWDTDVPDDLFDSLINLPGFEQTHISLYFNYLVAHPHIARAFNKLPFDHKLIWARNFVSEKFLGV
ncbi:10A19I.15 [Zea mays]|uniref:10A19I.15 n=1 Tax=Zea mays TaxID=4577 RepID=A0A1D6KGS1_MAIZE|nr:10A19I.15 [Zea mays]